jgi:xanthine dehydrogenase YagS FAD-binding subunit
MATLGGNLAQRPRCWYFRSAHFVCKKKGGTECFAQTGDNEPHSIFDNRTCAATHPSTIVSALLALDARVAIAGAAGSGANGREVELARFFVTPEQDIKREVDLAPGEIITAITLPPKPANVRTAYHKQVAKQSFDWPIVDVAVALTLEGKTCRAAKIVLGAVAPAPRRATAAEQMLVGKPVDIILANQAGRAALTGATPLSGNAHKATILEAVVARTILEAAGSKS